MNEADNLRSKIANVLRECSSTLLASFVRPGFKGKPDCEIRTSLVSWKDARFVQIQYWTRGGDGWKPDPAHLVTIRAAELLAFAGAVAMAIDAIHGPCAEGESHSAQTNLGDTLPEGASAE